jgi:hypothetical protein
MVVLFNKEVKKEDLMKRIGDISQLAGAKKYELASGRAKAREKRELEFIMPGESKKINIEIGIIKNPDEQITY